MKKNIDKFRGCLIGGAAGDALGYAIEFLKINDITAHFGKSGITEYYLKNGLARISDDTQMTLFTAGAFFFGDNDQFPKEYLRLCYKDWYLTQKESFPVRDRAMHSELLQNSELFSRRAPGMTCIDAIRNGAEGTITNRINDSKGCGGIMRVAPIGLFYTDKDPDGVKSAGYGGDAAAMTHSHDLGFIPAAAFTYIINALSKGETSLKRAVMESMDAVQKLYPASGYLDDFLAIIDDAIRYSESDTDDVFALGELGEGWVAEETLAIAVYCALKYQNDFDMALRVSVNHSGDSDSTGAVTGNILGTLIGYEAIPEKYKTNLELHDLIIKVADKLYEKA